MMNLNAYSAKLIVEALELLKARDCFGGKVDKSKIINIDNLITQFRLEYHLEQSRKE